MVLIKLLGLIVALIGIGVLKWFPDIKSYQPIEMTRFGLLLGVLSTIIGIFLLVVG